MVPSYILLLVKENSYFSLFIDVTKKIREDIELFWLFSFNILVAKTFKFFNETFGIYLGIVS